MPLRQAARRIDPGTAVAGFHLGPRQKRLHGLFLGVGDEPAGENNHRIETGSTRRRFKHDATPAGLEKPRDVFVVHGVLVATEGEQTDAHPQILRGTEEAVKTRASGRRDPAFCRLTGHGLWQR